jgi:hypothetical protein
MKKITLSLLALFLVVGASAQVHFGVKGGLNYTDLKLKDVELKNKTGWHAGVVVQAKLPLGFAFQPEILYSVNSAKGGKSSKLPNDFCVDLSYIEVPVNIQWGIDLMLLRPFLMAGPYFNYLLKVGETNMKWDGTKGINWGIGLGGGIDIWKIQVALKYNWQFGNLGNFDVSDAKFDKSKLSGFQISLGLLF